MSHEFDDDHLDDLARAALAGPRTTVEDTAIDVGLLHDYQQGALSEEAAAALEEKLVDDPDARALLVELGEPVPPFLSVWANRAARPARSKQVWGGVVMAFAMAAALIFFATRPAEFAAPPGYRITGVQGGMMELRSDSSGAEKARTLDPESVLTITLAPEQADPETAPAARAFVVTPDGRLGPTPEDALQVGKGGALRLKAKAADLFGEAYGLREVLVALGADKAHLAKLAGMSREAAQAELPSVRWLAVQVQYRKAAP